MKVRAELLVTCAALAIGIGLASPAAAADMYTKAPIAVAPQWWYEGYAEIGARFDMNHPDKTTLGKFYEYRDLRPGAFGNFFIGAHKTGADPLDIEVWGKNVGWTDQAFGLDISSPGTYYLTAGWDETPHVFSKDAKTMYNGVGTTTLTIPTFLTPPTTAATNATILANSRTIDVQYRRDTASAKGRWTPNDSWDFNFDYSHTHREGTQPISAVSFSGAGGTRSTFEMPRPVDDTTQNANMKGEYVGSTPWNTQFNVALGGGLSLYDNSDTSFTFQNPWNAVNAANAPTTNLYSLAPSNKAETISLQGGVGLPFKSRYMGTFQYTNLESDNASLPWTLNPLVPAVTFLAPNRDARTMLSNNVLHTDITSELKSTLKYRYYNYDTKDDSPVVVNPVWYSNPDTNGTATATAELRYPRNFTKQNADAQLDYRPWKWLNVGASYDWERWDREFRNVATTNENGGKIFGDAKLGGFSTLRASLLYAQRRYDNYVNFDGANIDQYRMNDLANRDRTKGMISWAVDVTHEVTITPNGGFTYDDYKTDIEFFTPGEIGLKKAKSWNAGIDGTFNVAPGVALFASYNFEDGYRQVYENAAIPKANVETTDLNHTIILGGKFTVIPAKLFLDANYTYTRSISEWSLGCTPAGCQYTPLAVYPDVHNTLNRVDVQAKYMLDDSFLKSAGFAGKAYVKARVLWEKNSNDSWQSLQNQYGYLVNPGANTTTSYSIWMGTGNPNYDVVLGQLSFGVKW